MRCAQAIRPYLPGDDASDGLYPAILIDTPVVYSHIDSAEPIYGLVRNTDSTTNAIELDVEVFVDGHLLTLGSVPLNATKFELPFSLADLEPRSKAYTISCIATTKHGSQRFEASNLLTYLPKPPSGIGSVTRMDLRTGALLAKPVDGKGSYSPVFPIGFYAGFGGYLEKNLSIPAELASQG